MSRDISDHKRFSEIANSIYNLKFYSDVTEVKISRDAFEFLKHYELEGRQPYFFDFLCYDGRQELHIYGVLILHN